MPKAKLVTDINNTYFTNNKVTVGTSAPTTGTYVAGDMVISSSANSNAFGWICTASGTPGSWKVLKSGTDVTNINWDNIMGRPGTYPPEIGNTSTTAFRGDHGVVAYNHSQQLHAPANAQRNADITKAEIEAKLTGKIGTHNHDDLYYTVAEIKGLLNDYTPLTSNDRIIIRADNDKSGDSCVGIKAGENILYLESTGANKYCDTLYINDYMVSHTGGVRYNSNTADTHSGKYIKLCTFTMFTRYNDAQTTFILTDRASGNGEPIFGIVTARIKQQEAMGSPPYMSLYIANPVNVSTNDLKLVIVENSASRTRGELYLKHNRSYSALTIHPLAQTGTVIFDRDAAHQTSLPSGSVTNCRLIAPTANDVGALPITGGDLSGNVTASAWRLNIHGGNCYVGNGNGDAATYNEHNMIIRSWYGIGFRDYQNVCRTVLDTRTGDFSTKGYVLADKYVSSGKFMVNGIGEWGCNYICGGNGDAANYDQHNIVIRSWYGIGFRDYQNVCRLVINTRTGDVQSKGALHASGYLSSPNLYLDDIRIKPYSVNGLSVIKPGGKEFAGLEVKELWLGPHSGATRLFTMSPSAPSSPSHGDVWIQNG